MAHSILRCDLDDFFKIHPFDLTSSQNAGSRTQKIQNILKNLYVLLGHGEQARNIEEAVSKLMIRNYPEILAWDGKSKLVVFVPEFYLNKATDYVNPEEGPRLLRECEDLTLAETNPERRKHLKSHENKFLAGKRTWMGEYPEMNLYNALTGYAEKKNESLAVFHGLNLFKFDPDRNPGKYTLKSLMLEVTPLATQFFKKSYKISHNPGLYWDVMPSFASTSQSAKIGLST